MVTGHQPPFILPSAQCPPRSVSGGTKPASPLAGLISIRVVDRAQLVPIPLVSWPRAGNQTRLFEEDPQLDPMQDSLLSHGFPVGALIQIHLTDRPLRIKLIIVACSLVLPPSRSLIVIELDRSTRPRLTSLRVNAKDFKQILPSI